mmetsp:Transcript_6418/g.15510  ORF Transcript_6418/g.15510 Transcript_6418/m.15510 type:complete len:118 (+) Transcript_6418:335-688(+)
MQKTKIQLQKSKIRLHLPERRLQAMDQSQAPKIPTKTASIVLRVSLLCPASDLILPWTQLRTCTRHRLQNVLVLTIILTKSEILMSNSEKKFLVSDSHPPTLFGKSPPAHFDFIERE